MLIAQHFVAGEGQTRLITDENAHSVSIDPPSHALQCDTTNLPWVILRAVHRATNLDGLSARARAVLAALARTVDAHNPYGAIFARRELLTGRALQSMRTFYRSLDDLEAAGLVHRPSQRRYSQAGLFGRAYLHLTEKAAALLGLVEVPETQPSAENAPQEASLDTHPGLSVSPPNASVADGAIYKDLYPKTQKRQPARVPEDLQRLLSLGFREFLVFKLMREARQHGKLLSDVVEATWEHLKAAKAPICYLRALLRSTADFRHQTIRKRALETEKALQLQAMDEANAVTHQHAGRVFFDQDHTRRLALSDDGSSLTVHHRSEASPRRAAGDWQTSFAKALRNGLIQPATPEAEFAFSGRAPSAFMQPGHHAAEAPDANPHPGNIRQHLSQLKAILGMRTRDIHSDGPQHQEALGLDPSPCTSAT
ncbi:hypothetical protein [Paraburkholderia sp.]|jgi:hypothetical protein|uniref:hypothetical protein n=1 Tax=Paraburkholderia sp. TaxID=1926495 RepID=UPI002F42CEBE